MAISLGLGGFGTFTTRFRNGRAPLAEQPRPPATGFWGTRREILAGKAVARAALKRTYEEPILCQPTPLPDLDRNDNCGRRHHR